MELNKIYNEDCRSTMVRMKDNFIDLTVTSPPYDNLRKYDGTPEWNDEISRQVISQLYRVTKTGGVVVWVVGDATINGSETGTSFKQALYAIECGFNLHDTMIFKKENPTVLNHNRYDPCFEYMFVWSKGRPAKVNLIRQKTKHPGQSNIRPPKLDRQYAMRVRALPPVKDDKLRTNIWEYSVGKIQQGVRHPATFPEALARDHIISWSNAGDIVYDPFVGSGTTAAMAASLNRLYIGSEVSEKYCRVAVNRLGVFGGTNE